MHKKTILMLGGFIGLAFSGITGAADMHTEVIASTCMSCHGPGGKSQGKIPSLTGLHKDHFVKVMTEFKTGTRASSVMKRLANGYTEAEIEAMGAYFANLK